MFLPLVKDLHPTAHWRDNALAGQREGLFLAGLAACVALFMALWYWVVLPRAVAALGVLAAGIGALAYVSSLEVTTLVQYCEVYYCEPDLLIFRRLRGEPDSGLAVAGAGARLISLGGLLMVVGSFGRRRLLSERPLRTHPTGP